MQRKPREIFQNTSERTPAGIGTCFSRPSSPANRSSFARVAAVGGTKGKRKESPHFPIKLSTVLTGAGFDSQKLASKRREKRRSSSRASFQLLLSAARIMRVTSAGASLDATLIKPCAPTAMAASARSKSAVPVAATVSSQSSQGEDLERVVERKAPRRDDTEGERRVKAIRDEVMEALERLEQIDSRKESEGT